MSRPRGGIDVSMYLALQTDLDLDQMLDLLEVDAVARSHRMADDVNRAERSKDG